MKDGSSIHQRVLHYTHKGTDVLYCDFHISSDGYDNVQVEESRQQYGSNLLTGRAKDTVLHRLCRAFINPFTIILFFLAIISFVTDVLLTSNLGRDMTTALLILGMLLLSGIVRFIQEMRSKRVADHLASLLHSSVTVRRDGRWTQIASSELVVGDTVRLCAGDRVPADIRLTTTSDFFVSQSVISGESAILEKGADTLSVESRSLTENIAILLLWVLPWSEAAVRVWFWPWGKTRFTADSPGRYPTGRTDLTRAPTPSRGC